MKEIQLTKINRWTISNKQIRSKYKNKKESKSSIYVHICSMSNNIVLYIVWNMNKQFEKKNKFIILIKCILLLYCFTSVVGLRIFGIHVQFYCNHSKVLTQVHWRNWLLSYITDYCRIYLITVVYNWLLSYITNYCRI